MADNIRFNQQTILDGSDGAFEVFLLKNSSSLEIIGIERFGMILYFIKNPKRNHMGYVIGVLPGWMQDAAQRISEFSQGYFHSFSEHCGLWAQYLQDGADRRFDRTGIINVEGKWQFWKSITYNELDISFFDIVSNAGIEFCESISQLANEIKSWSGFSTGDCIKASFSDLLSGYKKVRKYITYSKVIDDIC